MLLFASLLFILYGSTLPAFRRLRQWWRDYRNLLQVHPLWFSLTEAVASVRLDPPRGKTAELLAPRNAHLRLYRRTIEIRDAILALSEHAPEHLREQARAHVSASGLIGAQAEVATEACWLRAARAARLRQEPISGDRRVPASGGRDLPSEIQALKQLAAAYDSELARAFTAGLDRNSDTEVRS